MMGSEFPKKTKRTIVKHIDRKRVALSTPDLFTKKPANQPRRYLASITTNDALNCGENLIVEVHGNRLCAQRGHQTIARIDNPSSEILSAVSNNGGIANCKIEKINPLSKTAEVTIW